MDGRRRGRIAESGLPWHVTRLGCRAEYLFGPDRPRNGGEAHAPVDFALERFMHLYALNRGILLTPFHNMALMSPATTEADVDLHTEVFREAVLELATRQARGQEAESDLVLAASPGRHAARLPPRRCSSGFGRLDALERSRSSRERAFGRGGTSESEEASRPRPSSQAHAGFAARGERRGGCRRCHRPQPAPAMGRGPGPGENCPAIARCGVAPEASSAS